MSGSHQTAKLAKGRHRGPRHGVCAMELSSLLAGERFSDHPQQVCPVVAAFLRGYNDSLTDHRRQELFAIAAAVVGSRTYDTPTREHRAEALHAYAVDVWRDRRWRLPYAPFFTPENGFGDLEAAGYYVGRRARRNRTVHERTVTFVEDLIRRAPEPHAEGGAAAGLGPGVEPLADGGDQREPEPQAG